MLWEEKSVYVEAIIGSMSINFESCPRLLLRRRGRTCRESVEVCEGNDGMRRGSYIAQLIEAADNIPYMDYCRLLTVLYWNL